MQERPALELRPRPPHAHTLAPEWRKRTLERRWSTRMLDVVVPYRIAAGSEHGLAKHPRIRAGAQEEGRTRAAPEARNRPASRARDGERVRLAFVPRSQEASRDAFLFVGADCAARLQRVVDGIRD